MPPNTDALHTHAMKAEEHIEQLATGIAAVGAPDEAVQALGQCADLVRKVATGLAKTMRDEPAPEQPTPTTDEAIAAHMASRRAAPPQ